MKGIIMNRYASVLFVLLLLFGCAQVSVKAPKDPIKLDISMRLDIYQHVQSDIDAIENLVTGGDNAKGDSSFLSIFVTDAYAADGLNPKVEQAALNRKERRSVLISWEQDGVIGENKMGLVEIRKQEKSSATIKELIEQENNDRKIIYEEIANKNGISNEEVQKMYAKRLQEDATAGTPIEVLNESDGTYSWKTK